MDTLLIIVTVVSLAFAVVSLVLSWRVIREERRRSAARVEALLEAVSNLPDPAPVQAAPIASRAYDAAFAEGFGGPTKRETRAREPRVKLEAAPSRPSVVAEEPAEGAPLLQGTDDSVENVGPVVISSHELFHEATDASSGFHRLALPLSLGVVIVSALLAGLLMWNHGHARPAPVALAAVAADNSASVPLELISLQHERTGNGLSITGLVRNPSGGHRMLDLNVVVLLFDRNGSFVTSARGPLDFRTLAPGDESPFTVSLDKIGTVGRYRVSFRADDNVVPHVDRRQEPAIAVASTH